MSPTPLWPAELTDLSTHACYLKISAPFPLRTRVALVMHAGVHDCAPRGRCELCIRKLVWASSFLQKTEDEQAKVAEFLVRFAWQSSRAPQILVEPEEVD